VLHASPSLGRGIVGQAAMTAAHALQCQMAPLATPPSPEQTSQPQNPSGYSQSGPSAAQVVPCATAPNVAGQDAGCWPQLAGGVWIDQAPLVHWATEVQRRSASPPYSHACPSFEQAAPLVGSAVGHALEGLPPEPPEALPVADDEVPPEPVVELLLEHDATAPARVRMEASVSVR